MTKNEKINYINIQTGEVLDLEKASLLPDNALLKVRHDLWEQWDFEKNDELGLDIWKVAKSSGKKAWWKCSTCESDFSASPLNRNSKHNKTNCPYCVGKKVNHTNSLASLNPELAKEWHPTLNGDLTPDDVVVGSHKKVWWKGKCGHEWNTILNNRTIRNTGCPYCNGGTNKVLKGFNDMWTTNPELAKLLADPEDGYRYMECSNKKVDWKCSCGNTIHNKSVNSVCNKGIPCPNCSDGISYPEKLVHNLLMYLKVECCNQKSFKWSNNKRYDFYLPKMNIIIEVHGIQHYESSFINIGGRTLKEEQVNDKLKREMALSEHIGYVELDCRISDFYYIKNSILNSKLNEIFDLNNVNWKEINRKSTKSLIFDVCESYEKENSSTTYLMNKYGVGRGTIINYLNKGTELGLISYKAISKRPIVQLSKDNELINFYDSILQASKCLNIHSPSISSVLNGKTKTSSGYKWMYKEDYDNYINKKG